MATAAKTASSARELMQRTLLTGLVDRDSSLRFYGGFSFRSDHEASGVWADFPDSLFHLPAIELERGDSGDTWLGCGLWSRMRRGTKPFRGFVQSGVA